MRRRDFIKVTVSSAAAVWPLVARAQHGEKIRRVGVLLNVTADAPEAPDRVAAFAQGLQELGWTVGRNLRLDYRWGAGDINLYRKYAAELIALAPDVVLAYGSAITGALQQTSRTVPIVFVSAVDPVGAGLVESLSRPGGNATGFTAFEYGTSGKWLELVKEIAPRVTRAAVLRDPASPSGIGQFAAIQSIASSLGMELVAVSGRDADEVERTFSAFAHVPNGALIVTASGWALDHRNLITALAARLRLPAVYSDRVFVDSGGLISYGPNRIEQFRVADSYVNRILNGEKPAELPVRRRYLLV